MTTKQKLSEQQEFHVKKLMESDEFLKLRKFYPDFDLSKDIAETPDIAEFLRQVIVKEAVQATEPLLNPNAPKLDDDVSMYFLINNLPKCTQDKVPKLIALILKTLNQKSLKVEESDIQIPINTATNETDGVAFVKMANEEQARFGASIFDGFKLTKNNIFAACLLSEFDKVMQTSETFQLPQSAANLQSLRTPVFDVRREHYMFKSGKNIHINIFDRNQAVNGQKDEQLAVFDSTVDTKPCWSPKGTYLILIKADKVLFLGGEKMVPIITIPQAKVTQVHMSPCERYVLTYSPKGDAAFSIWNFQLVELIRDFQAEAGEDKDTYKWSYDGNYLAKRMIAETTKEGGESKVKEGISVYELPSMQLLANEEGRKKSITIEGISQWQWAPHRNLLIYTCVYA